MNGNDKDALQSSPSAALGIGEALINRKRLLVSLLSDREAVRVICAPPLDVYKRQVGKHLIAEFGGLYRYRFH